jgi:hypothetical protein
VIALRDHLPMNQHRAPRPTHSAHVTTRHHALTRALNRRHQRAVHRHAAAPSSNWPSFLHHFTPPVL